MGSELIGRKLFSSFIWTGATFAIFQIRGNFFSFIAVSNIDLSGKAIDSPHIYVIFIEILSKPCAFLGSKVFIINEVSFWKIVARRKYCAHLMSCKILSDLRDIFYTRHLVFHHCVTLNERNVFCKRNFFYIFS